MLPIQSIAKEKFSGPLTLAGDCNSGGGRTNEPGNLVRFVVQVMQEPEGARELRVPDHPEDPDDPEGAR